MGTRLHTVRAHPTMLFCLLVPARLTHLAIQIITSRSNRIRFLVSVALQNAVGTSTRNGQSAPATELTHHLPISLSLSLSHTPSSPDKRPFSSSLPFPLSLLAVISHTFMGSPRDCGFVSSIVHSLTLALALHHKCDLL